MESPCCVAMEDLCGCMARGGRCGRVQDGCGVCRRSVHEVALEELRSEECMGSGSTAVTVTL